MHTLCELTGPLGSSRKKFDRAALKLRVKTQNDWYRITVKKLRELCSLQIGKNLHSALTTVYPEYSWQKFHFRPVPRGYWKDVAHQRELFDWIAEEFGLETQLDWYSITGKQIY